jgi:glycine cleavage system H protein
MDKSIMDKSIKFTKDHEWVIIKEGKAWIGISDYAQNALGDIVFVDLPAAGTALTAGGEFGSIESVKAVSDLRSPITGKVLEVNGALNDSPELLNTDPYTHWIITAEVSDEGELASFMDESAYSDYCKSL